MVSEISNLETCHKFPIIKKEVNRVENIIALTEEEYKIYGNCKEYMALLLKIHRRILQINDVKFDQDFFKLHISLYERVNENPN